MENKETENIAIPIGRKNPESYVTAHVFTVVYAPWEIQTDDFILLWICKNPKLNCNS